MWRTEYRCEDCRVAMSYSVMMSSGGRCRNCGYKGKNACTIVDCTEHAYRLETTFSWKFPFVHTRRIYKRETE